MNSSRVRPTGIRVFLSNFVASEYRKTKSIGESKFRMGLLELFIVALGLSMDAFAVAICKGLATPKVLPRHMLVVGAWFGGFQGLMPLIGYFLGSAFSDYINTYDHWIAFALLAFIGGNMIREAIWGDDEESCACFGFKTMFLMAVATSIDALAVGVSFAVLPDVNIWFAVGAIGVITFITSAIGVRFGCVIGEKNKTRAEIAGGAILVLMGIKILIEHLLAA